MVNGGWDSLAVAQPISAERPCGESLEDLHPLVMLDTFRLFGQSQSPDAPAVPGDMRKPPDWVEVRHLALEGLSRSHDLRLLAYFATAALRTDGWHPFLESLVVASQWLESYWEDVHPVIDDDAMARRNALNNFADPLAVIGRLRRLPVVESRQHGRFALRDVDLALGHHPPAADEVKPEPAAIDAAFGDMSTEALQSFQEKAAQALAGLSTIEGRMREAGGPEMAPSFESLSQIVVKLNGLLQAQLVARQTEDAPLSADGSGSAVSGAPMAAVGAIGSREDALRALDAVTNFFRRHEPSSPVPLLIERAKRLVSKDFLEVLHEIAPEAVAQARAAGGLKDGE